MAIKRISEKEFYDYNVIKNPMASVLGNEVSWFSEKENNLLATIINDRIDNDWGYVILLKEPNGEYRATEVEASLDTKEIAETKVLEKLEELVQSGKYVEELYEDDNEIVESTQNVIITDINEEVKKYFKKHPEKLYDLSPRKFEELVASILEDMGLDIQLTKATRDGGTDIIASVKNALTSLLILVECKRYAPDNKVGVDIIRNVAGVHTLKNPAKSIIVTTSTFTKDAKEIAKELETRIDLKDYEDLKIWLNKY
ncbi:restriction endonuclease [Croceibacter atlanticus]|uniref:restriction endonuclease n=1 Tax=Croceibacter atlanticus TaxID=313588 RepID=UPI002E0E2988|nr:restriction endonuclease [Croceibacter atlanticus]